MSAFGRITTIAGLAVYRTGQTPSRFFFAFLLPALIAIGGAAVLGGDRLEPKPTLLVVNEEPGPTAERLIEILAATPFQIDRSERQQAVDTIAASQASMALIIPAGFAESVAAGAPRLEFLHAAGRDSQGQEARARFAAAVLASDEAPLPGALVTGEVPHDGYLHLRMVFAIYAVFMLLMLPVRGGMLLTERQQGTLQRTLVTGVPYREVIAGYTLAIFAIGLLQAVAFVAVTGALGAAWLSPGWPGVLIALLVTLIAAAGIAVAIAGFASSPNLVQLWAGGFGILAMMLGGVFIPLDFAPDLMQQIARLSPVYWAMEAFNGSTLYAGWSNQLLPLSVLLVVGILGLVVGVQGMRRRSP